MYNDKNKFETQILSTLKNQDIDYELIAIDNSKNKFKSAASAYNYGGEQAQGNIIVFSHQDITLKNSSELRRFIEYVLDYDVGDIIGAAGIKYGGEKIWNLTGGRQYDSELRNKVVEPVEAFSLDEVFIGMKKETFKRYHFNEKICDNWHFYAVEICLHALTSGHKNYIVPCQLHHYSWGNANAAFYKTARNLVKYYFKYFDMIWTTCIELTVNKKALRWLRYIYIRRKLGEVLKWNKIKTRLKIKA